MSHRSSPRPSSMGRRRIETDDEQDVHTGWYRVMTSYRRARNRSRVKRRTRRRERLEAKRDLARDPEVLHAARTHWALHDTPSDLDTQETR